MSDATFAQTTVRAVLTGHTRGLGAAVAGELLTRGIAVLGVSRTGNAELAASYATILAQIRIDFADVGAVAAWLADGVFERFFAGCKVALLINNAGLLQPVGQAGTLAAAAVARAVSVNVTAPLLFADRFVAASAGVPDRRLLYVSSGAARNAYPGWSIYCATKAALDQHARALALESHSGLRVASLAPGVIDTDMQAEIRATPGDRFPLRKRFVELKEQGMLTRPAVAARHLVDHLLGDRFGDPVIADLRET